MKADSPPDPSENSVSPLTTAEYFPALDGLRAFSVSLVVVSHALVSSIVPGGFGVIIFFVISGFLLTRQMIVEAERTGSLNIPRFYLRRFLRLAPTLLAYILVFSLLLGALGASISWPETLSALFYFANYYHIFYGYGPNNPYPILWSLAVEEHYYLVFPFCFLLFRPPGKMLRWLILTVLLVLAWRTYLVFHCSEAPTAMCGLPGQDRFHGTDAIFDVILYGAITSLLLYYHGDFVRRFLLRRDSVALALFVLLLTFVWRNPLFRDSLRYSLQGAACGVLIINLLFSSSLATARRLLALPPVVLLGKMSYALYLVHFSVLNLVDIFFHGNGGPMHGWQEFTFFYGVSLLVSAAAYYGIERPMQYWRKRFGSHNMSVRADAASSET